LESPDCVPLQIFYSVCAISESAMAAATGWEACP
jgi:hypothetical protein